MRGYSPHSFRVTTITDLLEQGGRLEDVQRPAGHADPRTTGLYDRRKAEDHQEHCGAGFNLSHVPATASSSFTPKFNNALLPHLNTKCALISVVIEDVAQLMENFANLVFGQDC